jgi:hypothetical protein
MKPSAPLWWFAMACVPALLGGCAGRQVPLTAELRSEHRLTNDDVRRLQLYVSDDIKLRRELEEHGRSIDGGKLRLTSGKSIDEVVIPKKTPCVAQDVSSEAITVAFDDGSTLTFALPGRDMMPRSEPLRIESGRFAEPPGSEMARGPMLMTSGLEGQYGLGGGSVRFRGREWEAIGESLRAHLVVDAEQLDEVSETHSVIRGRRL